MWNLIMLCGTVFCVVGLYYLWHKNSKLHRGNRKKGEEEAIMDALLVHVVPQLMKYNPLLRMGMIRALGKELGEFLDEEKPSPAQEQMIGLLHGDGRIHMSKPKWG